MLNIYGATVSTLMETVAEGEVRITPRAIAADDERF